MAAANPVRTFDVAIIGGGPGGYVAAIRARQLGLSTALIERSELGGVCLNWGCIPTKALIHCANLLSSVRGAGRYGITCGQVEVDYSKSHAHSRRTAERLSKGVAYLMRKNGVEVFQGFGYLVGEGEIRVEPVPGSGAGERAGAGGARGRAPAAGEAAEPHIHARNVIIATGARPRGLPGIEPDGRFIFTSREALALTELPRAITIVGAGAVGVEFAHIFQSFGVQVTLLELLPRVTPAEDPEVGDLLRKAFESRGIQVHTEARLQAVNRRERDGFPLEVVYTVGGEERATRADAVLLAAGVQPNSDGIGLESVGAQSERGYIIVDDYMRTSARGVYAIGDVTGRLALAHVASAQGEVAVEAIAGQQPRPLDYVKMPRATYCHPQVASAGLTEPEARERGYDVQVGRFPFRANGRAIGAGESEGFVKVVADGRTGEVLGVHLIGPDVTELLAEVGVGLTLEATVEEFAATVHTHPTLSEAVREAMLGALGRAIHM